MSDDYDVLRDFIVDAVGDGASVDGAERAKLALKALQERAERLEKGLRQMASEPDRPGPDHAAFAKNLLSRPTQETDPE